VASLGCAPRHVLTPSESAAIESGVRAFAQFVAADVTREGPSAWRRHFADTPSFFMAVNGRMAFPDSAAATAGIQEASRAIRQIELHWGDDLRVDPLAPNLAVMAASYHEIQMSADGHRVDENGFFTGTAESDGSRWQFRNAHWSSLAPPAPPR
jgi:hypothetical protein